MRSAWVQYGDGLSAERWLADGSGFVAMVRDGASGRAGPGTGTPWCGSMARWSRSCCRRNARTRAGSIRTTCAARCRTRRMSMSSALDTRSCTTARRAPGSARTCRTMRGPRTSRRGRRARRRWCSRGGTGGHDGGRAPVLLDTRFEPAPFSESLAIHVAAGDCLNLRPGPAPDGEPIECIADGTVVTFIARGAAEGDPATRVRSTPDATWLCAHAGGHGLDERGLDRVGPIAPGTARERRGQSC